MKPLTAKEVEYIVDSMSNEDLLIKQCVVAAAQSPTPSVQQFCQQLMTKHQQHYQGLLGLLQEHASIAPKTVQEAEQMTQMQQQQAQMNVQHEMQMNMQQQSTQYRMQ